MANPKVVMLDPASLKDNPYQPQKRTDPSAIRTLAASIDIYGVLVPVAVTPDYYVLDGHRRIAASILHNIKKVPCIIHNGLTAENFGLLNQSTKALGSAAWMEAFVRSQGNIKEMPKAERKRCEELLKIFGSYRDLDRWFVAKGQGSYSVLTSLTGLTNLFAVNEIKGAPSKKQIGMWMLHHNLAWVCRNLLKDLCKGKSNTSARLKRLARKISRNEKIDDEF